MGNVVENFINAAMKQDIRNKFKQSSSNDFPVLIAPLYANQEPVDVEITLSDFTAIRFYSSTKFLTLAREYNFDDSNIIIFASWEGDPIYIFNQKICISSHGKGYYKPEQEFSSIIDFLDWILQNIQ